METFRLKPVLRTEALFIIYFWLLRFTFPNKTKKTNQKDGATLTAFANIALGLVAIVLLLFVVP
jgi:hypothetical protein